MSPERWREIEDLYHAALEREPRERAALLECSDPDIRSQVERMLALDSDGKFLDRPAADLLDASTEIVLTTGSRLGPYRIEAAIGAGGMGKVYRAVDTRLGRVVAIKIANTPYSERFEREARAISALNHPHICTLYDVGPDYLVMELIEGTTLAEEIKKGPLETGQVARYGEQISSALAEAHARGIVHRDLKPSNIMLTRHGVKVLDFGLAKMLSKSGATESKVIMGTPGYMAPEQLEGREPTGRSDLFALGLVLYEMAVGRLPFPGASLGQMLNSGANSPVPPPSQERAGVPASLDALVGKLLEKDPAWRPQSASEVARELSTLTSRAVAPPPAVGSLSRPKYAITALVLLLLLAAGAVWLYQRSAQRLKPIPIEPGSYVQLTSFTDSAVAPTLSPDGRMLAFFRSDRSFFTADQVWVKLLPNGEPVQLTHDPRQKYNLAFSPDGSRIAYTVIGARWDTYTVSSLGGDSKLLLTNASGLSWMDEHTLLFSEIKTGLHMGIVTAAENRAEHREIYFSPNERDMAHYSYPSPDRKSALVVEMDPQWQPCRLVPLAGGSVGRQVGPPGACTSAAWSPDGAWMYFGVLVAGKRHLWRQRFPDGQPEQMTSGPNYEDGIAVAPDGRSLITSIFTGQYAVWTHDSQGDRAVSTEGYVASLPSFSSDGKRLYYLLRRDSPQSPAELWRADLDSGKSEVVMPGASMVEYDISSDEKDVVYSTQPAGQPSQVWLAPLDRSAPPRRISATGEVSPRFGPDGQVLFAFTDGKALYFARMGRDGSTRTKVVPTQVFHFDNVSPDRSLVILTAPVPGSKIPEGGASPVPATTIAVPVRGGPARRICESVCTVSWSPDGKYFYVEIAPVSLTNPGGKMVAIPVPRGETLPRLPASGIRLDAEKLAIPGIKIIDRSDIAPGLNPSTYAYLKTSLHANLFRIPLR